MCCWYGGWCSGPVSCFRSQGVLKIRDAFYNTLVANRSWGQVSQLSEIIIFEHAAILQRDCECWCAAKQVPQALHCPSRFTTRRRITANGPSRLAIKGAANRRRRSCCTRHVSGRSALARRVSGGSPAPHSRHNSIATNMVEIISGDAVITGLLTLCIHDSSDCFEL